MAVRQLLAEPNPKDPLEVAIAEECASQPELFKMKARQHVAQHAKPGAVAAAVSQPTQQQETPAQAADDTRHEPENQAGTSSEAAVAAAAATDASAPAQAGVTHAHSRPEELQG